MNVILDFLRGLYARHAESIGSKIQSVDAPTRSIEDCGNMDDHERIALAPWWF